MADTQRRRSIVTVRCGDCNCERNVRADYAKKSKDTLCKTCTAKRGGKAKKPSRITGKFITCGYCNKESWKYSYDSNKKYCSKECSDKSRQVYNDQNRVCETCKTEFIYREKPRSNSNGKFCSRKCYTEAQKTGIKVVYRSTRKASYARYLVGKNIKKGILVRPKHCTKCGSNGRIEAAHHDYDKPLSIRWLCVRCHRNWDANNPKGGTIRIDLNDNR